MKTWTDDIQTIAGRNYQKRRIKNLERPISSIGEIMVYKEENEEKYMLQIKK